MRNAHREPGRIGYVKAEDYRGEGREPNTVFVGWESESGGSCQGFGGLALDKKGITTFLDLLCTTFGVKHVDQLKGKPCFALRSFGGWNEPIWGLESKDTGRRMTLSMFRRTMGYDAPTRFQERTESLRSSIVMHERRAEEDRAELARMKEDYVEWD